MLVDDFFDPFQVFRDVHIDVGSVWVGAVIVEVERHNTDSLAVVHQRTPRITLWEEGILQFVRSCLFDLRLNQLTVRKHT